MQISTSGHQQTVFDYWDKYSLEDITAFAFIWYWMLLIHLKYNHKYIFVL